VSKFRKSAQGEDCCIRIPGVCSFDPETTVLAHLPFGQGAMGSKSPDLIATYSCASCHDVLDRRTPIPDGFTPEEIYIYAWEGHARTLLKFEEKGLI